MYIYRTVIISRLFRKDFDEGVGDRRRLVDLIKDFILYRETH